MPTTKNDHTTTTTTTDRFPRVVRLSTVASIPLFEQVKGVVYDEALTVLCGAAGSGKSTLARQMAAAVTVGSADWLTVGEAVPDEAAYVLWLGSEESPAAVRAGFERLGVPVDLDRIHYVRIDDVRTPDDLGELAISTLAALVVVDPAADLLRVRDWNDYGAVRGAVRRWFSGLLGPYCSFGALALHHSNRKGSFLGSAGLAGAVDLLLEVGQQQRPAGGRELRATKSRDTGRGARFEDGPGVDGPALPPCRRGAQRREESC